jgi:hypothetical protein
MTDPTAADRQAQLEGGLQELACDSCGALVRVKKNSAMHTSVQWSVAAARQCGELADRAPAAVATCGKLRDSIERAVWDGRLSTAP